MYIPAAFAETDLTKLHDFIEDHSFGLLISEGAELPATHLPFLLERQSGHSGHLLGHMARANPQWQQAGGRRVLAIFSGPHAYISPTWYEAESVVPTWNYVAVHVYGTLQLIDGGEPLLKLLRDTVERFERAMPQPWTMDGLSPEFLERLAKLIVGFRIDIDRIEGKWKLNQNHSPDRRQRVIAALLASSTPDSQEIAALMQATLASEPTAAPPSTAFR